MLQAYEHYAKAQEYELAIELTKSLPPMFPRQRSVRLRAQSQRAWADHLLARAADLPGSKAAPLQSLAREQLRKAGRSYALLANARRTTPEYSEHLRQSAECFLLGRDYEGAERMLNEYLKDPARSGRPQALVARGEARLALDKLDKSLTDFLECIEFHPKNPASYQARLLASKAYVERGNLDRARQLLLDNLHNEALTPESAQWRDSLFALGRLLHVEGNSLAKKEPEKSGGADPAKEKTKQWDRALATHQEAIRRLSEAVKRYGDDPQVVTAHYLIAESHRQSARVPQMKLATATIRTVRDDLNRQTQKELNAALAAYDQLQELLNRRQEKTELTNMEKRTLRNCYFAKGAALFDLGRFSDAIQAYSTATNRYQHEPESIEAFVQIANCHRRLNRPDHARATVEQAKGVLQRIRKDADFTATTRYTREEWATLLDWLGQI